MYCNLLEAISLSATNRCSVRRSANFHSATKIFSTKPARRGDLLPKDEPTIPSLFPPYHLLLASLLFIIKPSTSSPTKSPGYYPPAYSRSKWNLISGFANCCNSNWSIWIWLAVKSSTFSHASWNARAASWKRLRRSSRNWNKHWKNKHVKLTISAWC